MKQYILYIAAGLLALSCTKTAVEPLSGKYPEPKTYSLTQLTPSERTKDENGKFHFPLSITSAAGDRLDLVLMADTYYIPDITFSGAVAENAKAGNYIADESSFAPVGETAKALNTEGTLNVTKEEDHYTVAGYLWTVEGKAFRVEASFDAVYEPEKEAQRMDLLVDAKSLESSVLVYIGSGDITVSADLAGNPFFTGDGKVLMLELDSADGKLYPGTYTVGDNAKAGDFWTYEYAPGMLFTGGSGCNWFGVKADGYDVTNLNAGVITVTKTGSTYDIEYKDEAAEIWVAYTGAIEALDYEVIEYITLTQVVEVSQGEGTVTVRLASEGITATYNETMYSWSYSGTGNYVTLELYSADGSVAAGSYKACAIPGWVQAGEFGTGFEYNYEYAPGMFWPLDMGSVWFTLDGAETKTYITDGMVTVSYEGDTCTIVLESSVANAKFVGQLEK